MQVDPLCKDAMRCRGAGGQRRIAVSQTMHACRYKGATEEREGDAFLVSSRSSCVHHAYIMLNRFVFSFVLLLFLQHVMKMMKKNAKRILTSV